MRETTSRLAIAVLAVGCLAYTAALTWTGLHLPGTWGSAGPAFEGVEYVYFGLAVGLAVHAVVLGVLAVFVGRGQVARWLAFGLVFCSLPIQGLVLYLNVHDHGSALDGDDRVGVPAREVVLAELGGAGWMAVASLAVLVVLAWPRPANL